MKKILITVMMSCCMALSALSQSTDSFFSDYYDYDSRYGNFPEFPDYHGSQDDYNQAPLESGTFVLALLGVGYVMAVSERRCKQ